MEEAGSLGEIAESLRRMEAMLGRQFGAPDGAVLDSGECWRWQASAFGGTLLPVAVRGEWAREFENLCGVAAQAAALEANTRRFAAGAAANHALLTGGRGCGKSTMVRGVVGRYVREGGVRMIETDAEGLARFAWLQPLLAGRAERFVLFCDDLSFGEGDALFGRIKSALEGALTAVGDNVVVYATSNRRNLVVERFGDNLPEVGGGGGEIRPLETVDEKVALADRFGLWLSFYAPDGDGYDAMVAQWLRVFGRTPCEELRVRGRRFADQRGSRNGRVARQFVVGLDESPG